MTSPFSYDLPPSRIAQRPVRPYHDAKLLVIDRSRGTLTDSSFLELPSYLSAGDLLIFNNSKVIPARLFGKLVSGGEIELLLLSEIDSNTWRCTGKPLKKMRPATKITLPLGLTATVIERSGEREILVSFNHPDRAIKDILYQIGSMPIPPYIRGGISDETDKIDYQTAWASVEGSIAAPTASLHFTPELLARLSEAGLKRAEVTLHIGFASINALESQVGQLSSPPPERCEVSETTMSEIAQTKSAKHRVVAVGTTSVRALESHAAGLSEASVFITPGHTFRTFDTLITNFHQPSSTHLLLVEAFLGRALLERAYQHALTHDYRFLSYGDGMLIV